MSVRLYSVVANVRKVGAIGVFYEKEFPIAAHNPDVVKGYWFNLYSREWELNNFVRISEREKDGNQV